MKRQLSLTVIILATALGLAQTASTGSGQTGSGDAQSSTQATQSSQTSTPKGSSNQPQTTTPATKVPGGATDASGGGVAGAAGSAATGQTQVPETAQTPSAAASPSDNDLQSQIQNALSKEPTLSGDSVNVTVSADSIAINGSVATSREKQTATRIVQSYAGNKKVVSHLTISGHNRNAAPAAVSPKEGGQETRPGTGDLSAHPEPNKGTPPATSARPPL